MENEKKEENQGFISSAFYEAVSIVITSIFMIALVFTFGFRLVGVSGHSMDYTLNDGDWLVVTHYYSEPKYGDIIINTKETMAEGSLVKRVIGVAGDVIDIDDEGFVYLNGVKLEEDYTIPAGCRKGNLSYPLTVPEDSVFFMGDNRPISWDSRYSEIGFAKTEDMLGKAQLRLSKDWNIYSNFKG